MVGKNAYYRIVASHGALIVPITPDGNIVCVRQYRPALNMATLELPAGEIDSGETPEQAAARELYEETGYRCQHYEKLYPSALTVMGNRTDAKVFIVRGKHALRDSAFKPREDIDVVCISPEEFKQSIAKGTFLQLAGLAAVLLHERNP